MGNGPYGRWIVILRGNRWSRRHRCWTPNSFPGRQSSKHNGRRYGQSLTRLLQHREALPRFQDIASDQYRISSDDKWRAFVFYGFGHRSEHNSRLCPQTARLLDRVPGIENAFFSILAPGKVIPSHHGVTKGLVRCHLGLIVPPEPERCFMDVGDVRCTWQEGRTLLFDDTYPHAVQNNTEHERVVLLFDFCAL